MDSVPQFHVDSLLFLGSHQRDIWVVFFLWRVYTGSLKFSGRREAENKLGWLQERELEKTFFFFASVWVLQQKETRETQTLPVRGKACDRCEQGGDEAGTGMRHQGTTWTSHPGGVPRLAGSKHRSNPRVQLLHMDCRNASQRLLERTLGSKGSCAKELDHFCAIWSSAW